MNSANDSSNMGHGQKISTAPTAASSSIGVSSSNPKQAAVASDNSIRQQQQSQQAQQQRHSFFKDESSSTEKLVERSSDTHITTIPEGSAVSRTGQTVAIASIRIDDKSPSPSVSSAPTTGTTTTPVSNVSSHSDRQPEQQHSMQHHGSVVPAQHLPQYQNVYHSNIAGRLKPPGGGLPPPDFAAHQHSDPSSLLSKMSPMSTSPMGPSHQQQQQHHLQQQHAQMVDPSGWGPPSLAQQHMYPPLHMSHQHDIANMYYGGQQIPQPHGFSSGQQQQQQRKQQDSQQHPHHHQEHQQQSQQHESGSSTQSPPDPMQGGGGGGGSGDDGGMNASSDTPPGSASQQRYNPANYPAALKLLVSNNVAGSIIGRSGQTISELQQQSLTRIKLSQTGDYYPGTQDRVCLVQGEPDQVKTALRLLLDRLYMLQEHQHSQHMAWQLQKQKGAAAPSFDFVVRLLVPSSSCGMLIGKSGSNIKFMEETTGVSSVRLSPKDAPPESGYPSASIIAATSERIVSVTGPNLDSCVQCIYLVVDGMAAHPDICRYTNMTTSYSRIMPDAYIAGTPRPLLVSVPSPRHSSPEQQLWQDIQGASPYGPSGLTRRIASSPDLANFMLSQRPHEPPTPERLVGYSTGSNLVSGPPPSFPSPAQLPVGTQPMSSAHSGPPVYLITQAHQQGDQRQDGNPDLVVPMHHSMSAPDLLSLQFEQSMHLSAPQSQPSIPPPSPHMHQQQQQQVSSEQLSHYGSGVGAAGGFIPQAPTLTGPGCFSAQVLVPDAMIGSILGRGGRALTELQMLSGTRIRISQRGDYMPGTRSRIVSIRGQTAQSIWQAQFMMSQRMVLPPTAVVNQPPVMQPLGAIPGGKPQPPLMPQTAAQQHQVQEQQQPPSSPLTQHQQTVPTGTSVDETCAGGGSGAPASGAGHPHHSGAHVHHGKGLSPSDASSTTAPSSSASSVHAQQQHHPATSST